MSAAALTEEVANAYPPEEAPNSISLASNPLPNYSLIALGSWRTISLPIGDYSLGTALFTVGHRILQVTARRAWAFVPSPTSFPTLAIQ